MTASQTKAALTQDPQTWLYPEIEPYTTGRLKVNSLHDLYYEECGNPKGKPVIFVHGGPGGGVGTQERRFFNPEKYRIILMDQRGAGKSLPAAELEGNTTWDLVADLERLREHLKIPKWQVFGGSWGSTLGLTYAISHPDRVTELVLRGIFLLRKKEIAWYYQEGCNNMYPDLWEEYRDHIPENERGDFVKAYYSRLTHSNVNVRMAAAKPWTSWEMGTSRLYTDPNFVKTTVTDDFAYKFARIECHYFINKGFFAEDNWILNNISKIRHIPAVIVQGRYDVVCPPTSAWDLHRAWPEANFFMIPDSGHAAREPGTAKALVSATDRFAADGVASGISNEA
ncbi:MAG: prolyl aminopeptidase [Bdellovibrionales bacterium]|nr:prolyl aminopeptidase [Bdellovibrionales bacterium]